MTQTPAKFQHPADGDAAGRVPSDRPTLDMTEFTYYASPSASQLRGQMQTSAALTLAHQGPPRRSSSLGQRWANLTMRSKLVILLFVSAAIPTLTVTQGLIALNKHRAIEDAKAFAAQQAGAFRDEYVLWAETDAMARASNLARLVEATEIDINDPNALAANASTLKNFLTLDPVTDPETAQSFQMVVNAQGKTVAQDIRLLATSGKVPVTLEESLADHQTVSVTAPLGLDLQQQLPLVKSVLTQGQPQSGVESLSSDLVKQLKLTGQLQFEDELVAREGRALTAIAVNPITDGNGKTIGAVIVGSLFNNNYLLMDTFRLRYAASAVAVFDREVQVATSEPGEQGKLRQTQVDLPMTVEQQVLDQGQDMLRIDQQGGHGYLHYYSPLYDATQAIDETAKPVGMTYVGQSLAEVEARFMRQQLFAYALGGGMLLLSTLLALPAAGSVARPLQKLSGFMQRVGRGDRRLRLMEGDRQDEVGSLMRSLNQMVSSLEQNEHQLQQEVNRNRILSKIANLRSLDSHDLAEGLQDALEEVRTFIDCDRLVIYRCGSTAETGRVVYEAGLANWPSAVALKISDRCIPESVLQAYRAGQVKANADVLKAGFGPEHLRLLEQLKIKASLIVPIHSNQELYGLLIAHSCSKIRNWTPIETAVMQAVSDQIAVTLGYITLLEQQRSAQETIQRDKETLQRRALELLQEVDPVSQGDLTVRARVTEDEIGTVADSYNSTVESLRKIVRQVQGVSAQVSGTAIANDVAVQNLAQEALRQAEQITSSLSHIQSMTETVQALTQQAMAAQTAVATTTATVEVSDRTMTLAVEGMTTIRETVAETTRKMEGLEEASQRISQVIRLISTFAAQTHMLAMKASIEAARAGERGEGFAVIADEVRSLAARSAQATADIEAIINSIQLATQDVLAAMEVENKQVAKEMQLVDDTRVSLTQITAANAQVTQLVTAIAQTTETQTQASDATARTIVEVADLVRQTSAEASKVSESFKGLLQAAQLLQAEVARFKVD